MDENTSPLRDESQLPSLPHPENRLWTEDEVIAITAYARAALEAEVRSLRSQGEPAVSFDEWFDSYVERQSGSTFNEYDAKVAEAAWIASRASQPIASDVVTPSIAGLMELVNRKGGINTWEIEGYANRLVETVRADVVAAPEGTRNTPQSARRTMQAPSREWLQRMVDLGDPPACTGCGAMAGVCSDYPNCPGGQPVSCLCCGKVGEPAVWKIEDKGIYVCRVCKDGADRERRGPQEDAATSPDVLSRQSPVEADTQRSEAEITARRTAEYWKAELNAANVEIERLRAASPSDTSQGVSEADEIAAFEKWAKGQGFSVERGSRGFYTSLGTNQQLSGWLARAALRSEPTGEQS